MHVDEFPAIVKRIAHLQTSGIKFIRLQTVPVRHRVARQARFKDLSEVPRLLLGRPVLSLRFVLNLQAAVCDRIS